MPHITKNKRRAEKLEAAQLAILMKWKGHPFATKVYIALQTKLPITFINKHWRKLNIK